MKFFENMSKLRKLGEKERKSSLKVKGLFTAYKVFGRHYKKYWKILTAAYLSMFATIGVTILAPWPLKLILDHLVLDKPFTGYAARFNPMLENGPRTVLIILAASIVLIAVLKALFSYMNKFWVSSTGERIIADIRERVFAHLQRLSLSFHETARSGDIVYLMSADMKELKNLLIKFPQDFLSRFFTIAAYVAMMLVLEWRLGLIALSTTPLLYIFTKYFGTGMNAAMKKKRKKEGKVSSIIYENVTSMALIQAYGQEDAERDRFNSGVKDSLQAELSALRLQRTYSRVSDFLVTMSTAGVLYYGGLYALGGQIAIGTLVVFVAYLRDIYSTVESFSQLFLGLAKSQASSERLVDLVETDHVVKDLPDAKPAPGFKGRVEFKDVSFAYKNDEWVLKDVRFYVKPGETVALVGHSGAGKSTLISLLLRFYDPQKGRILIDRKDITRYTLKSLRDQITIVMQDAKLFRQTIRENIGFGKPGASDAEIVQAAKLAQAHEFIMQLPQGYETPMHEGGDNLSGGQKQRINIARAIIRDTPIIIMDEPTTGLDAESEALINQAIRHLTQNRTTFIIAHKFSTIANADKIILLDGGKIAHMGSHDRLLHESDAYRELYNLQFGAQGGREIPAPKEAEAQAA